MPIKYEAEFAGITTAPHKGHDNWVSNLAHRDISKQLSRGASFGQIDKLEDQRARFMTGKLPSLFSR